MLRHFGPLKDKLVRDVNTRKLQDIHSPVIFSSQRFIIRCTCLIFRSSDVTDSMVDSEVVLRPDWLNIFSKLVLTLPPHYPQCSLDRCNILAAMCCLA